MSQLGPPCLLASPSGAVWSFAPPFRKPYSAEVVVPVASIATPPPALKVASSGTRVTVEEGWNRCKRACVSRPRFTCLGDNNKRVWVLRFRLWYCRTIHVCLLLWVFSTYKYKFMLWEYPRSFIKRAHKFPKQHKYHIPLLSHILRRSVDVFYIWRIYLFFPLGITRYRVEALAFRQVLNPHYGHSVRSRVLKFFAM
jgi:hypothetical protein